MTHELKLIAIGESTGVILPEEMLTRRGLKPGDSLLAVETPDGYLLTPHDAGLDEEIRMGRDFMRDHRDTFRALARR